MALVGWSIAIFAGIQKFGLNKKIQIAIVIAILYLLWLIWERYSTYVGILHERWLINSKPQIIPTDKSDIYSILFVGRVPDFIFRSWGARAVFFLRGDNGEIRQTYIAEDEYTEEALYKIFTTLLSINPHIELDDQYAAFMAASKDNNVASIKSEVPKRSVTEVEAYVRAKYVSST
jgi:hypothetical protein